MSDAIYDDVIRIESERVEMTVDIYESADRVRDHDFRTETNTHQPLQRAGSDCVKIRNYRAAAVCLVLLCVLLLTAVIVLCVHIYTNNTNYTEETKQLLTNITDLTEERDQLLTKITNLTEVRNQLLTKINNLTKERNQMLTNTNNLTGERDQLLTNNSNHIQLNKQLNQVKNELLKCFNGMDGWLYYKCSFYFISSEKKSWTESRRYCTERGADLIIINNREEQNFFAREQASGFWIGLTDSDVDGSWKWVDSSTLTSGFWKSGEPNENRKENCAVYYPSGWSDYPCYKDFKWICEKNILERTFICNA